MMPYGWPGRRRRSQDMQTSGTPTGDRALSNRGNRMTEQPGRIRRSPIRRPYRRATLGGEVVAKPISGDELGTENAECYQAGMTVAEAREMAWPVPPTRGVRSWSAAPQRSFWPRARQPWLRAGPGGPDRDRPGVLRLRQHQRPGVSDQHRRASRTPRAGSPRSVRRDPAHR